MNEQKLKLILKQLTALANLQDEKNDLQDEKNDSIDLRLDNLQKQIFNIVIMLHTLEKENLTKSERIT